MLKRVYYSAYIPVNNDKNLPSIITKPPLLREHRLYQADWLLRFYDFSWDEIVTEEFPNLDEDLDPKTFWALNNLKYFTMEINTVPKEELLRIPGIGARGVMKILSARRFKRLTFDDLEKLKISIKKAKFFITCNKEFQRQVPFYRENLKLALIKPEPKKLIQASLFDFSSVSGEL